MQGQFHWMELTNSYLKFKANLAGVVELFCVEMYACANNFIMPSSCKLYTFSESLRRKRNVSLQKLYGIDWFNISNNMTLLASFKAISLNAIRAWYITRWFYDIRVACMYPVEIINGISINTLRPRRNGRHFADDILTAFSWMKIFEFRFKFHGCLFPRIQWTIFQHWIR